MNTRQKGLWAENLIKDILLSDGYSVYHASHKEQMADKKYDLLVDDTIRIEVKMREKQKNGWSLNIDGRNKGVRFPFDIVIFVMVHCGETIGIKYFRKNDLPYVKDWYNPKSNHGLSIGRNEIANLSFETFVEAITV